jgi:endonuclease/exonuclease/phosphatase family metal-dependent hydrolase
VRHYTLSPSQTAKAHAALGTARHLFFRIKAVRAGGGGTAVRAYAHLKSAPVAGRGSSGNGTKLRFAAYNVHVASKDVKGHPWSKRQHQIAKSIAKFHPAVVGLEEMMVNMWSSDAGGVGLNAALRRAGAGRYRLTRATTYWKNGPQDTRILYDPSQVTLASNCDDSVPSCYIMLPDSKKHIAAYARFHVSGTTQDQDFYFVSAHLTSGNTAKKDALRGRQAQAMSDGIKEINAGNDRPLPVIFSTDANSAQTSPGVDAPHAVLLHDGWYNTQAAATVVNEKQNSVNHYLRQRPSPYGFGAMYDSIMTLHLPGADLWKQVLTGRPQPSDHNLIFADLRLP